MVIRIPDFMFAQSTGKAATPGEPGFDVRSALANARSTEKEIASLGNGLALAGEALAGGEKAAQKLAAARNALGRRGDSGALRWLLDHAAAEQARQETAASRKNAMRSLIGAIKGVGTLPIPFAERVEIGRTLLQEGIERGVVAPQLHKEFEAAVISQLGLTQAQSAIAKATEPGEALAVLADPAIKDLLQPMDSTLLDREAKERDAVAVARHRARLTMKEQDDLAAFARGEQPEPLSEHSFKVIHGEKGAADAYAHYQAARELGEARAQIRGKDADGIEAARDAWKGEPAVFATAKEKDALDRRHDPAGYALDTVPGAKSALDEVSETERAALLWSAQAAAGIPAEQRSPWTRAEEERLAAEWDALPSGSAGQNEKLAFLRKHILSLPLAQRAAAIRRLAQQGIVDGTEAELALAVQQLADGSLHAARSLVGSLTPIGAQYADSGAVVDDGDRDPSNLSSTHVGSATTLVSTESALEQPHSTGGRQRGVPEKSESLGAWEKPSYEPEDQQRLLRLLEDISQLRHHPLWREMQAAFHEAQLEGLPWSPPAWVGELDIWQRIEALGEPELAGRLRRLAEVVLDPGRGFTDYAQDLDGYIKRVRAGDPFDEVWANAKSGLAEFERNAGLVARVAGPGIIEIALPGEDAPPLVLPVQFALLLADDPEAVRPFQSLAKKIRADEDYSAELRLYQKRFIVTVGVYRGRQQDSSRYDEIAEAVEGAKARLGEGASPDEVFLHLAQVVLADELDDTDLVLELAKGALQFAPYYDLVDAGIDAVNLYQALDAGDWGAAGAAGLSASLNVIGSVPGAGDIAEGLARWVLRHTGLLDLTKKASLKWLTHAKTESDRVLGGRISRETSEFIAKKVGNVRGTVSNSDYLRKYAEKIGIDLNQYPEVKKLFERVIIPTSAEKYVHQIGERFVQGSGFRIVKQKRHISTGVPSDGYTVPDMIIVPENMTEDQLRTYALDAVNEMHHAPVAFVDAKTGFAEATKRQQQFNARTHLPNADDLLHFFTMPQRKIPASVFGDVASQVLAGQGRRLSLAEQQLARRLAEKIQQSLPSEAAASQVLTATVLAVSSALDLTVVLASEAAHEEPELEVD